MSKTIFLPHGGGPMPLLQDEGHKDIISLFQKIGKENHPDLIVIFSAHHETEDIHVIYDNKDQLTFDYYGFPKETYNYQYRPPKDIETGKRIVDLLNENNIKALSSDRGFDHGVFVPLMLMYPKADIPVIQISLKKGLDPEFHIKLGESLRNLDKENILFLGSGFSFHNLRSFFTPGKDEKNESFHDWLVEVITGDMSYQERRHKLINWLEAPNANYVHPRSEHLIPLHITFGLNQTKGNIVFDKEVLNKRTVCVEW